MCTRSRKLKRLEDVSHLKKDPFAHHSNYSFEILILVMFLKNCQNMLSFSLLIMPTALSGGGRGGGGGLIECYLTFKVGYLIKRGAWFETRRNYNIPLLILVMFLKNCQNVLSFALLIMPTALSGGGRGAY